MIDASLQTSGATKTRDIAPLCVDLDGTLIKTDMVWESLVRLLKNKPINFLQVPFWLLRGRAYLKAQVAEKVRVDPATLPYCEPLLDVLRAEIREGRQIILATASDHQMAEDVASHVGLFKEVLASDGKINLRGKNKAAELVRRFGVRGFDYAGNSTVDLPVWEQSREALVVNGTAHLASQAGVLAPQSRVIAPSRSAWPAFAQALRPHQWVKNLILFVPLLTAHQLFHKPVVLAALMAFVAFCICASGVYVLNDLLDLDADRHHPTKRLRPFASGDLPLSLGLAVVPVLLAAGLFIASQ